MVYIAVSLVGRKNIGMSSSFSPACLTQYTSFLKPPSSSSSRRSSGSTPSSLTLVLLPKRFLYPINSLESIMGNLLLHALSFPFPNGLVHLSISSYAIHMGAIHPCLIGYLLSTNSKLTIKGYQALKSSTFDGIPRLALPLPIINTPCALFIKLPHYFLRNATIKTSMLQVTAT